MFVFICSLSASLRVVGANASGLNSLARGLVRAAPSLGVGVANQGTVGGLSGARLLKDALRAGRGARGHVSRAGRRGAARGGAEGPAKTGNLDLFLIGLAAAGGVGVLVVALARARRRARAGRGRGG